MITRLQISGFKNLEKVDIRFGPFTCIAGANGVGKSNLFDAILFLSALADQPLIEAATAVRDGKNSDIRSLFHRVGDTYGDRMTFEVEMLVPLEGEDDLGQKATAATTFLTYKLEIGWRADEGQFATGGLQIIEEELVYIKKSEARKHLLFNPSSVWINSVVRGKKSTAFISTSEDKTLISLHQDRVSEVRRPGSRSGGGPGGRPSPRLAATLPRTLLSVANAAENRTAVLARRELQSWRLLQLEPTSLRKPDNFSAPTHLEADGSHLTATINRLARTIEGNETAPDEERLYARITNKLKSLIEDVRGVSVDRDEKRELLTLLVEGRDGTRHPARALSDGTLRFLALAAIELDPAGQGVLCFEEPENGIHPARVPAMLRLLQDIAIDTDFAVGSDNPLRQVIVNTHSPSVVRQIDENDLVVAETYEVMQHGQRCKVVRFGALDNTWRTRSGQAHPVAMGTLLAYLSPDLPIELDIEIGAQRLQKNKSRRVMDRQDLQPSLFGNDIK